MNNEKKYSAGIFAKRAGVTIKTIRHYDKIGILKPTEVNEKGYRIYSQSDFAKLQKILTLKFLGYSLSNIGNMMEGGISKEGLQKSIQLQKDAVNNKIAQMEQMRTALEETENMLNQNEKVQWEKFINIIDIMNIEDLFLKNFKTSQNLNTRINLHTKYSTSKQEWFHWVFDQINIEPEMKVLEIACGTGLLWKMNTERIPKQCEITLTDRSESMLDEARTSLSKLSQIKAFKKCNMEQLPYEDNSFDVVIANHVLYFIKNREIAFKEIRRVLKDGGKLYTSTFGKDNFKEVKDLLADIDDRILLTRIGLINTFYLEDGEEQLSKFFGKIEIRKHNDSLKVTDNKDLVEYLLTTTGNIEEILEEPGLEELRKKINDRICQVGHFLIKKDHGIFISQK